MLTGLIVNNKNLFDLKIKQALQVFNTLKTDFRALSQSQTLMPAKSKLPPCISPSQTQRPAKDTTIQYLSLWQQDWGCGPRWQQQQGREPWHQHCCSVVAMISLAALCFWLEFASSAPAFSAIPVNSSGLLWTQGSPPWKISPKVRQRCFCCWWFYRNLCLYVCM